MEKRKREEILPTFFLFTVMPKCDSPFSFGRAREQMEYSLTDCIRRFNLQGLCHLICFFAGFVV